jgi:uncharacterized protein YlzI (FlbEa/FlbD family)
MGEIYNFIQVTSRGLPKLINLRSVISVEKNGDSVTIKMVGGETFTADYKYEEFIDKLRDNKFKIVTSPSIQDIIGPR